MEQLDPNVLLTDEQAAEIIGLKVSTIRYWRYTGEGPAFVKVGGKCVRYRLADINEWIESRLYRSTSHFQSARKS